MESDEFEPAEAPASVESYAPIAALHALQRMAIVMTVVALLSAVLLAVAKPVEQVSQPPVAAEMPEVHRSADVPAVPKDWRDCDDGIGVAYSHRAIPLSNYMRPRSPYDSVWVNGPPGLPPVIVQARDAYKWWNWHDGEAGCDYYLEPQPTDFFN